MAAARGGSVVRLVRFDDNRTGVVVGEDGGLAVVDVTDQLPGQGHDWRALMNNWRELAPTLQAAAQGASPRPLRQVRLHPPLPSPSTRIFAMGVNFQSHVAGASKAVGQDNPIAKRDDERPPAGFFVIPGTVIGPEDEVVPPADAQKLDYEAEVAVVLGEGGRNLSPGDLRVWGYTGYNDVSIRDPHLGLSRLDEGTLAWGLQKNFQGGNIVGPWLTIDPDVDLGNLKITSSVNGQQRQNGSTEEMIRSFGDAVAYLSHYLNLAPGDMLTSGTPAGTAIEQGIDGPFLRPGDTIEIEIGEAGVLRNRVGAAS